MNQEKIPWIGACLAAIMAVTLYVGLSQDPRSLDDAYITYRYARNIAQGRGFVYNVGEPVLGTTTPFYTLLLAGLSFICRDIPTLSHIVGVLAWVLCVPVIYGIAEADGDRIAGLVAASLIGVNALFLQVLTMETTWYVLVTLLAFFFYVRKRLTLAGLCAGLAFLTRWDGVLVIGVLLFAGMLEAWVLQEKREHFPWALLVALCVIVPWLAYSQVTFGSIFPNTFFAKAGQGWKEGLGGPEIGPFTRGLVSIARSAFIENRLFVLPLGFFLMGMFSVFRSRVKWWPVLLWTAAYFAGYAVLGVLRFSWYYPPLVPAFVLLVGQGIEGFIDLLAPVSKWRQRGLAIFLIGLCLIPNLDWLIANRRSEMSDRLATYVGVGEWLRASTPSDSSVATIEIGVVGYYSDRTIVDTMGLVSPEMIGHLQDWTQTLQFALNHYWPDYAVALEGTAWGAVVHEVWFEEAYVLEKELPNLSDPDAPIRIYRRRAGFPPDEFALSGSRDVRFDGKFVLERFQVAEGNVGPGGRLHARMVWKVLTDLDATYLVRFDLVNAANGQRTTLRTAANPMRGGNPTELWRQGDRIVDDYTLQIPTSLEAGPYLLQLLMSRKDGRDPTTSDRAGNPVDYVTAGPIQIGDGVAGLDPPEQDISVAFGDNISLAGYDFRDISQDEMEIVLYWKARDEVARDYTVFVHLVSPDGDLVAQHDSPPALPTTLWVPGTTVIDSHPLSLPLDSAVANYEIRVGMYQWPDLERLPVLESGSLDAANNALLPRDVFPSAAPETGVDEN
jgi:hypothetical protein